MAGQAPEISKEYICAGLLAHVDAGKTTLSEAILYLSGSIRRLGRVDNRDAFLDTYELERARGITIFSKQAVLGLGERMMTLLDTPGHVDFSAEMERTLQVLDCAILVISGADGVQGHTETLWRLLKRFRVPVFLFINKMDQPGTDRNALMAELKDRLDGSCIDFSGESRDEELALCEEGLLDRYLETGEIPEEAVRELIGSRKAFPCFFGSALKLTGVEELLEGISRYVRTPAYKAEPSGKVFKISRDSQGNRLTHMKVTGGSFKVKEFLPGSKEEKINQIRIYSGQRFETVQEAGPGMVCALTGPVSTRPGQGIGGEMGSEGPVLEPVLTYQILLPEGSDVHSTLKKLLILEEEEPQLHITWNEAAGEIQAQVMGEVQIEILKSLILERFQIPVEFGRGSIVYKETISRAVEGVGHFEPLRHYAEVHLVLEPGEAGSGLQFDTDCSEDVLDRNWQRLVLTHLEEKQHRGVLTGSAITDMKIILTAGRAHLKHTEGGDFRQATYRAIRQGLMEAKALGACVLLEPWYVFRLEVPSENLGRAMTDMERMKGVFDTPENNGDMSILTGSAPAAAIQDYQREVISYTRGRGHFSVSFKGYEPCHNTAEVMEAGAYDPEAETDDPSGSVFCAHGAGYNVPWNEVKDHMHLEATLREPEEETEAKIQEAAPDTLRRTAPASAGTWADDKELEAIFNRTFGENKWRNPDQSSSRYTSSQSSAPRRPAVPSHTALREPEEEYLLVDGYNIIFAWEELRELSKVTIDGARHKLMDILCNYQGVRKYTLIVVFDAYKVAGNTGEAIDYHNIHVVYTKEAETADQYIEKLAHRIGRRYRVTVATSDGLEQLIIYGQGCLLMSAKDLREDIDRVAAELRETREQFRPSGKRYLFEEVDEELSDYLEGLRLGKPEK